MSLFARGVLKPLPHRVFSALEPADAFRYMQHSRQIGKIVISFPPGFSPPVDVAPKQPALRLREDATYLVTGGLSGFGLKTAQWLARKGARHLVLASRRGDATPEAAAVLAQFSSAGVAARAMACDVTDRKALAALLAQIGQEMPPLRGVVHAAMVIEDSLIARMSAASIHRVFAPKLLGALHLHELTRDMPLDLFVLYSSATTFFGNPGQSNYVAANMLLEALAADRRMRGLPATCVSWGPIADAGYLARNEQVRDTLVARMGGQALTADECLQILERLVSADAPNLGALDLEWSALRKFLPTAGAPKYAELSRLAETETSHAEGGEDIRRWLESLNSTELHAALTDILKREVGEILRVAPENLDENKSVYDIGMDSLMGVELVSALESRLGVTLPLISLSEGPTIVRLVDRLVRQIKPATGSDEAETTAKLLTEQVKQIAMQHGSGVDENQIHEFSAGFSNLPTDSTLPIIESSDP
jgi:NAD(P)-dependent dehydrogenase (short-subunit alcohol dehydrogenase family)/acyl carrier protein